MYFPFFRARQFELLALRDTIDSHINVNNIKPIIEPVNESTRDIFRFCEELEKVNAGFILIINPSKGFYQRNAKKIEHLITECVQKTLEWSLLSVSMTGHQSERLSRFLMNIKSIQCH
ncbi:Uncharacterised protein [Grimontia hollisae]|nr:Uncharacterised protein [Grimontia hollisae]